MSDDKAKEEVNIVVNRKAKFEYFVLEHYEAGIVLTGTEVKSLRAGRVNIVDSHAAMTKGEMWLYNLNIQKFDKGNRYNHEPTRARKLLLHKKELSRLFQATKEKGLTIIPLRLYFKGGSRVKVEIGLCKGKKLYDKRATMQEKDSQREVERMVKVSVS